MVSKYIRIGKISIGGGVSKRFGIGICIDKWSISIDLGPAWVYVEW